ncbi:hypothetical protein AQS8620_00545 [Aquimixticola soesokkakensis]|uniref:Uncharacterized protein n=1 Tax=Aquimixticola soesokkakensis TaxID=1519096 RepID=A0A1Y5RMD0_9RHOB|nr:hypothetical protein AQS8620_00545 [Aquimixticola soesokkakensis]
MDRIKPDKVAQAEMRGGLFDSGNDPRHSGALGEMWQHLRPVAQQTLLCGATISSLAPVWRYF